MKNTTEVSVIEKKLIPLVEDAVSIKIKSDKDMEYATEVLSTLNKLKDRIDEEKEKITKPLNEALKAERARWKPVEQEYERGIEWVRNELKHYQTAKILAEREAQAKIADKVASGKMDIDKATKQLEKIETVSSVTSDSGKVTFKEVKKVKITDIKKIPREFLVVDEKLILEALLNDKKVPGAEIEIEMVPINRRK